ncbi:MAG: response regulator, partial [Candidatus Latescibacteria bacterium]|nr:response regulator [Candidatus Latescibacterota bacterium]
GRGQAVWDTKGNPMRMSGSVHDIHDERLAGDWLRIQTAALDAAANGIVITDPRGMIIWSNRSISELTGYTDSELLGRSTNILKSDIQEDGFYGALWQTISRGSVWHGELINRRKDGSLYPEEMTITPVKGSDGEIVRYVAIKQDITERKKAQQALIDERNNLEDMVQIRTQELNRSLQELKDANLSLSEAGLHKNRFLSSMSHELRTPLNAILGFSDLLKGQFYGELNEKQSSYVQQIDDSGKHLLDLINDLLDIAKIDAGAMTIESSQFPPVDLLDGSVSMMGTLSRKKNIVVETKVEPDVLLLAGDLRKCKQIMYNLLSNAIKYTPEKGHIRVHAGFTEQSKVRISVTDTGIGVPEALQDSIFSEFFQADRMRDEALGGTGIGLALTRRLVELHGGEIGLDSLPGQGSTFWFTLPAAKAHMTSPGNPSISYKTDKDTWVKSKRILVAEDNPANLKMIKDMLSIQDHEVAESTNGREAIDVARTFVPDLILMDIRMPEMDGLEATQQLRRLTDFASTPIVALTANADADFEEECLASGCTAFLTKPLRSETLFRMLERLLTPQSLYDG